MITTTPTDSKPCFILVVEDSEPVRQRVIERLTDVLPTAQVEGVETAVDAVSHFSSHDQTDVVLDQRPKAPWPVATAVRRPDVIVLDLELPGCNGLNLLRAIKRIHREVGVIIFTCLASDAVRHACLSLGADFFISKGEDIEQLEIAVCTLATSRSCCPDAGTRQAVLDPTQ